MPGDWKSRLVMQSPRRRTSQLVRVAARSARVEEHRSETRQADFVMLAPISIGGGDRTKLISLTRTQVKLVST
jgi:hypothetical protein